MRVLLVLPFSPEPHISGAPLRIHYLLKHLVEHHQVSVICFGMPGAEAAIKQTFSPHLTDIHVVPFPWASKARRLGQFYAHLMNQSSEHLEYYSPEMQETIDRVLLCNTYDIVQAEFFTMGGYNFLTDTVKIVDAHNVEYDIYRRMATLARSQFRKVHYTHEYKRLFIEELAVYRKQNALFVTSLRDKEILDLEIPALPKFILPNGVDTSYFVPDDTRQEPHSIVFTGMMGYVPNHDGMLYFLDEIFPLIRKQIPQVKIYIVGDRPPKELLKRAEANIVVTGYVDDVRPFISKSTVYVVPLRMGGGTRLKIFEAFAMKRPIVTTIIGCEGIDLNHRESGLIADEPQEFAESVVELFRNQPLRKRLAENGYNLARAKYEWSIIGNQMEAIYHSFVQQARIPAYQPSNSYRK